MSNEQQRQLPTEERAVIDYLDKPPQRYRLVGSRSNEGGVIELERSDGKWMKFEDVDLYMFEGGQLALQLVAEFKRLKEALAAISDNLPDGEATWEECAKSSAQWAREALEFKP